MPHEGNIYLNSPDKDYRNIIERLTQSKNWDSDKFNEVMITLGLLGEAFSVPAINRPETIHLQKFRKYFEELLNKTKETNREYARAILIDTDKKSVVMSGKISEGDNNHVSIDVSLQPGREIFQTLIGTIHTHPTYDEKGASKVLSAHGFSGQDYKTFLSDRRQQFMVVGYGEISRLIILKTSVTPNNLKQSSIENRINELSKDYLSNANTINIAQKLVAFNKMACVEFGLTFYLADKSSNDLFNRINVTE